MHDYNGSDFNGTACCLSAGVMFWADATLRKIESAYTNGTARTLIVHETGSRYFALLYRDGHIYVTDWSSKYVYLFITMCTRMQSSTRVKVLGPDPNVCNWS